MTGPAGAISVDLTTRLGALTLANPIMPASGCFGPELAPLMQLHRLGALVTKTIFSATRSGNAAHRLTDTGSGALNSVGIPSPGASAFRSQVLPAYRGHGTPVIVSIGGLTVHEYFEIADDLQRAEFAAFEVNVSCPNLEHGGISIGSDPEQVRRVTQGVVERANGRPVIVKLTPNVASIEETARAAEEAGAAALTVANTFIGLAIDVRRRRAVLGNGTGGLSGRAIKPLALRLVWEASRAVSIPVVGCGGIATPSDVVEFLMAGATAVQIGTATFSQPDVMVQIVDELPAELAKLGCERMSDLVGSLQA
ncbi:MAG: dihydroorotate dehydrogenase catalytic subunit [Mycobacterium sp.]|nr:dihydroorotate dehydrogenase catalytic subunit [Mycobacterium sp.]